MTKSELARDKLKYWKLIGRARKLKSHSFQIPDEWMKYGNPLENPTEVISVCLDAYSDKWASLFDQDDAFYRRLKK